MSQHRWRRLFRAAWTRVGRRGPTARAGHGRRPVVEVMESRELLSTIAEFPTPTAGAGPLAIALGPDGHLWFTESGAKIAVLDPATHAITEFATPTASSGPQGIAAGPDGRLWFTEFDGNRVGMIDPSTHAIAEFPVPTVASRPLGIAAGSDGNLWFTEYFGNKIGMINPTTHAIIEFPVPTTNSLPVEIAAGSDGNLWFTEANAKKIGSIDPTSHAIVETPLPPAGSRGASITAGSDGNLWFTELDANKVAMINPTTRAIVEFPIPTAASEPVGIAAGPDGNLWFTEELGNRVGMIDPSTHAIAEFPIPTAASEPIGIAAGPDGNLWFTELVGNKVGVVTPPLVLSVTAGPPTLVAPSGAFGLIVTASYPSGRVASAFGGEVRLALADPGGVGLGGPLTAAAHDGVASFTGLTIDRAGTYRILASIDPQTTALTAPVTVAVPPAIVAERPVLAGKGRRRRLVGYQLDFSTAMDPARAASAANYSLVQLQRRRRQLVAQPVAVRAAYDAAAHRVTLTLAGKPKFVRGGRLVVVGAPPGGLTDAAGVPLDGSNQAAFGNDGIFVIAPKGKGLSR